MKLHASDLSPEQTYRLMTGVVVPRPIAWISSLSQTGVVNLAPFSCYTIVSNKPPMIGVNIGRKAGQRKDTGKNILDTQAFVVNIADQDFLGALHQSAHEYAPDVSEVEVLGLNVLASEQVAVPRLAGVPISLECVLHSVTPFGLTGAEFYVGEIVMIHVRDSLLNNGKIDTAELRPVCRLAGPNYAFLGQVITLEQLAQTEKSVLDPGVSEQ